MTLPLVTRETSQPTCAHACTDPPPTRVPTQRYAEATVQTVRAICRQAEDCFSARAFYHTNSAELRNLHACDIKVRRTVCTNPAFSF